MDVLGPKNAGVRGRDKGRLTPHAYTSYRTSLLRRSWANSRMFAPAMELTAVFDLAMPLTPALVQGPELAPTSEVGRASKGLIVLFCE